MACCNSLQQLPEQAPYQHFIPTDLSIVQSCSQVGAAELHDQHMRVSLHAAKVWAVKYAMHWIEAWRLYSRHVKP